MDNLFIIIICQTPIVVGDVFIYLNTCKWIKHYVNLYSLYDNIVLDGNLCDIFYLRTVDLT